MYRRRRIIALVALLLAVALVVFCVYSLARGGKAVVEAMHHDDVYALSRSKVPSLEEDAGGIKDCKASDLKLGLTSAYKLVQTNGSLKFTGTISYQGTSTVGCLIDDSQAVLTITSGDTAIYRSDLCSSDPHQLLMDLNDKDSKEFTWNLGNNAALTECPADENTLEKVKAGDYQAQLTYKGLDGLASDKISFTVTE